MKAPSRSALRLAAVCIALSLSGCGLWPWGSKEAGTVSAGKPGARASSERAAPDTRGKVKLPVPGTLAVFVDPKVFTTRTVSSYGIDEQVFNERAMIEQAAISSFGRVYSQVMPYQEDKDAQATLSLTGDSYYNPIMRTYYVNVRASMYIGDAADSIGTYKSKAQYDGGLTDPTAFQRAYKKATDDIASQIVSSAEFAEAVQGAR
jgi:hypothetical protein